MVSSHSSVVMRQSLILIYCFFSLFDQLPNKKIFQVVLGNIAMKSLRKTMSFVMELMILAIFKAQANVLTPPSLFPTSPPIHIHQSSQDGNDHRRRCAESAFKKCEHITEIASMMECAIHELFICIASSEFQTNPINFFQFEKELKT